jgi:Fe-S-cluster containining protein
LSLAEARQIAGALGVSWHQFRQKYLDQRWPGTNSLLIRQNSGRCAFLKTSRHKGNTPTADCVIHAFKPACCREWKAGLDRAECQQGLKILWGVTVDSSEAFCGPREKIQDLQRFIKWLST